jgi:hypothetical protein
MLRLHEIPVNEINAQTSENSRAIINDLSATGPDVGFDKVFSVLPAERK